MRHTRTLALGLTFGLNFLAADTRAQWYYLRGYEAYGMSWGDIEAHSRDK
jgi:hypothetical protein